MKHKKIRRIKTFRLVIFLLIIIMIWTSLWYIFSSRINSIYIDGNYLLTEQDIIDESRLTDYPLFVLTTKLAIKKRLLENEIIEDVKISKTFFDNRIDIKVKEYQPLFIKKDSNEVILSNKKSIKSESVMVSIPTLINYVPDTKYDTFIKKMGLIDKSILNKISEIEYLPNEYDKERFLFYMADTNHVYLTLTKFNKINNYDSILLELNGLYGTIYLDSGNHFQPF